MRYDVIIVGGGPAGTCCAYQLSRSGANVALIEKAGFPRDKVCGDALSLDVVNQLEWMDPVLAENFRQLADKLPSYGIRFVSPGGHALDLPIIKQGVRTCGYTCERSVFDHFLMEQLISNTRTEVFFNCRVKDVRIDHSGVQVHTDQGVFTAEAVVGADGAHSIINKKTINNPVDKLHFSAGLRQYYSDVSGFNDDQMIELHFFKDLLPGYFWMFPLPGNKANVGLGVLSSDVIKRDMNLKEIFYRIIREEPSIRDRFAGAKALEEVKGYGLPLGSRKRPVSASRVVLIGDAAGLIDPFSGEGVGNAIRSGRIAAEILAAAIQEKDFSGKSLLRYDHVLQQKVWTELRISRMLQKLANYPQIFDFLLRKAEKNAYVKNYLHDALADVHKRKFTTAPAFLFNLFFR